MRIHEIITDEEFSLLEYLNISRDVSKRIKEQYDMLMQELVDDGYDIDELMRNH
jgi:hypothetical protein